MFLPDAVVAGAFAPKIFVRPSFEEVLFRYSCFEGRSDILLRCVCMCFTLGCFGIGLPVPGVA